MLKKILSGLCALALLFSCAMAQTVEIKEISTVIGENYLRYPQLSGMADSQLEKRINDEIVLLSKVTEHMVTLVTLGQTPWNLKVDYKADVTEDGIFSAVLSARGKMGRERDGHAYTAFTYDLSTGERLALSDVFTNVEEAVERMEAIAEESLSEELNGYMEFSQIIPLPEESFTLNESGITFYYPREQFSLLSGISGACHFTREELSGLWQERFEPQKLSKADMAQAIRQSVAEGCLPQVPVKMGQRMQEVCDTYRLLRTPDEFPGGKYFVMEDPLFRGALVISDALESKAVEGVQLKRGALHGLTIGTSTQEEWRNVLGEPEETIDFTENMAYDYNLPSGQVDIYHFGENELRLHADEAGVLCAIQICN